MSTTRATWREYLIEAACLAAFMMSAAAFATLLNHPSSPFANWTAAPIVRRIPMGLAMGLTAAALIYSPWGIRSGAHMNPAVTVTYLRLRRIPALDACGYIAAQFAGGAVGIAVAVLLLGGLPADPSVNYVATRPGPGGPWVAALAEAVISFGLMLTVLTMTSTRRLARFTGLAAAALVALYIVVEDPLSGMSMNPARSTGPALMARSAEHLWIYFVSPLAGMLLAAEAHVRHRGRMDAGCAKFHHPANVPCVFRCGGAAPAEASL